MIIYLRTNEDNQEYMKIGEYKITVIQGVVYIFKSDGEGGGFNMKDVEKCLEKFYEANF